MPGTADGVHSGVTSPMSVDDTLGRLPAAPMASSRALDWDLINVDLMPALAKFELEAPAADHHTVTVGLSAGNRLYQKRGSREYWARRRSGEIMVVPANESGSYGGAVQESIVLRLPQTLLTEAVSTIASGGRSTCELRHVFGGYDKTIENMCSLLQAELTTPRHPVQRLIVDGIATALAAHLIRSYDAFGAPSTKSYGLGPATLTRVICYMEDNLSKQHTLGSLAGVAGVSRFHFLRMFKKSLGITPMAFLEKVRIERACALIKAGTSSFSGIAALLLFSDQSHFSRRFSAQTGYTPSEFAARYAPRKLPADQP